MTFELLFGIGLIAIGAFSSGSFSIPFGKTRNWSWENYWLIYSLFAYVIVPVVACLIFVQDLWMYCPVSRHEHWDGYSFWELFMESVISHLVCHSVIWDFRSVSLFPSD